MRRILSIFVLVYLLLCTLFYGYQHLFFFQPKALDANHILTFPVRISATTVKIPFDANTVIDVVRFAPDSGQPRGVVLFFHGNRFNVEHYSKYAPYFTKKGFECWMPDYPGYGRSSGTISVEVLQQLSLQLYQLALQKFDGRHISVYGKSLGTGVAAYLAWQRPCRQLILETPYSSLSSLAGEFAFFLPVNWLMRYQLNTRQYMAEAKLPITMLHGTADELISYTNAVSLLSAAKPTDAFYSFVGGKHNNLPNFALYHHVLDSLFSPPASFKTPSLLPQ
ncbi:MAG: alpha/beta fold hydrolase [Bacteroidetes bacterium]|nr:MAG: alpha/beta fold hydrolase [Bacteroidota bacterium]